MVLRKNLRQRAGVAKPTLGPRTRLKRSTLGQEVGQRLGRSPALRAAQEVRSWRPRSSYRGSEQPLVWSTARRLGPPGERPVGGSILESLRRAVGGGPSTQQAATQAAPAATTAPGPQARQQTSQSSAAERAATGRPPMTRTAVELEMPSPAGRARSSVVAQPPETVLGAEPAATASHVQAAVQRELRIGTLSPDESEPEAIAQDRAQMPGIEQAGSPSPMIQTAGSAAGAIAQPIVERAVQSRPPARPRKVRPEPAAVTSRPGEASETVQAQAARPATPEAAVAPSQTDGERPTATGVACQPEVRSAAEPGPEAASSTRKAAIPGPAVLQPSPDQDARPLETVVEWSTAGLAAAAPTPEGASQAVQAQATPPATPEPAVAPSQAPGGRRAAAAVQRQRETRSAAEPKPKPSRSLRKAETPVLPVLQPHSNQEAGPPETAVARPAVGVAAESAAAAYESLSEARIASALVPSPGGEAKVLPEILREPAAGRGTTQSKRQVREVEPLVSLPLSGQETALARPGARKQRRIAPSLGLVQARSLPAAVAKVLGPPEAKLGEVSVVSPTAQILQRALPVKRLIRRPTTEAQVPVSQQLTHPPAALTTTTRREMPFTGRSIPASSRVPEAEQRAMPSPGAHAHEACVEPGAVVQLAEASAAAAPAEAATAEAGPGEEAPAVDLDTMVQQVYQILRRRLRVELERAGRGMR